MSVAIECPELTLDDGVVTYTTDMMADFELGTVATHTCNPGFALLGSLGGSTTRTCVDDDGMDNVGVWIESLFTCGRKYFYLHATSS